MQGKSEPSESVHAGWDGTSIASPHIAAAAALLKAKRGGLSVADVRERLTNTADRVPGMNHRAFHPDFGFGRLNLRRLLA
jgi:hypothetical protein